MLQGYMNQLFQKCVIAALVPTIGGVAWGTGVLAIKSLDVLAGIRDRNHHNEHPGEDRNTFVKLPSGGMKDFTGNDRDWAKFKSSFEQTIASAGFEQVLTDRVFATAHARMNQVVFSHLSSATMEGTSGHLIIDFTTARDGHGAWNKLLECYEGVDIQDTTAEEIRNELSNTILQQGKSLARYIDTFMKLYGRLRLIDIHKIEEITAVHLFLLGIKDEGYQMTIVSLQASGVNTLEGCIRPLRLRYKALLAEKQASRTMKVTARNTKRHHRGGDYIYSSDDEDDRPKKRTRATIRKLSGAITLNASGLLQFSRTEWTELTSEEKKFVQDYNAKTKHQESTEHLPVPDGVTLVRSRNVRFTPLPPVVAPNDTMPPPADAELGEPAPGQVIGIRFGRHHPGREGNRS